MKLVSLLEPILNYTTACHSAADIFLNKDVSTIKRDVLNLLSEIETELKKSDEHTNILYRKIELPLLFFIDYIISNSKLPAAEEWDKNRLAYAKAIMTGDKKFFDIFEEIYMKNDPNYDECLEAFYLFISLGFKGLYESKPEKIKNIIYRISNRIPAIQLKQAVHTICQENYDRIFTVKLTSRRIFSLRNIIIFGAALFLITYSINFFLFYKTSLPLISKFKEIQRYAQKY